MTRIDVEISGGGTVYRLHPRKVLTKAQRQAIAREAARARWEQHKEGKS